MPTFGRRPRHVYREPVLPSFSLVMLKAYPALAPVIFPMPRQEFDAESWSTTSSFSFASEDPDEYDFMVGDASAWFESC
jgi:hypothetical protein